MTKKLTGTQLYSFLEGEYGDNFQTNGPSFGNLLWQLIINEAWSDRNIHCFTQVYDNHGLVLGIAENNEQGYYNTHVYFNKGIEYDQATGILAFINEQLFGLMPLATGNIIASSMRGKVAS